MGTKVEFESKAGKASGEVSLPSADKAGGVVIFHEWWGLNDHMRSIAEKFAAAGFVALALDSFDGQTTKDPGEAAKLMNNLDFAKAITQAAGAVDFLKAHARCNGKVAVTGFCLGGGLTLAAACNIEGLSAVVPFYGMPDSSKVDYAKVTAPILGHFATRDYFVKPENVAALDEKLKGLGKDARIEMYEADHAFVNDTRPEVYSPDNAKLALDRTFAFLHQHLD